jgi:hypothetical protein
VIAGRRSFRQSIDMRAQIRISGDPEQEHIIQRAMR